MVYRLLKPIFNFPEFTPVLTVGPESEMPELAFPILELDSGPTVSTGHRVPSEFMSKYQDRTRKFTTHFNHVT